MSKNNFTGTLTQFNKYISKYLGPINLKTVTRAFIDPSNIGRMSTTPQIKQLTGTDRRGDGRIRLRF